MLTHTIPSDSLKAMRKLLPVLLLSAACGAPPPEPQNDSMAAAEKRLREVLEERGCSEEFKDGTLEKIARLKERESSQDLIERIDEMIAWIEDDGCPE